MRHDAEQGRHWFWLCLHHRLPSDVLIAILMEYRSPLHATSVYTTPRAGLDLLKPGKQWAQHQPMQYSSHKAPKGNALVSCNFGRLIMSVALLTQSSYKQSARLTARFVLELECHFLAAAGARLMLSHLL